MNKSLKRVLSMALALCLVLSLFCTTAMAAPQTTPSYPHLSVGAASVTTLEAGDTVRIPVSLAGLGDSQYLSGMSCNVTAMNDGYLTVTDVEFASSISGWSGGYNAQYNSVNKVNLAFAEHPEDCLHNNGLLFTVVCTVAKDIPAGTNTGIQLSSVSMNQTSTLFLNSLTGKQEDLDSNAVIYPVDGNGNTTGGVSIPAKPVFAMTISADEASVEMDEIVTITITGNGGVFDGVDYQMTYDPNLFELVTKPEGATQTNNTFRYTHVFDTSKTNGDVISTYTFKALAQDNEVEGAFTLLSGKCFMDSYGSSVSGNSEPCQVSGPATVKITLKDDLTVSADDVTVDFDNRPHSVTATANKAGADIKYADATGAYTLTASPAYTNVGKYTVKFCATLKGYEPAYGEATITIDQPKYFTETTEYVSGYTLLLVYTNYDTTRYTYDGNTMLDVSKANYSLKGKAYEHVYGWVVKGEADTSKIGYTASPTTMIGYSNDVNASGEVDMRDVLATSGIYNADKIQGGALYMTDSNMEMILRADVNHDKTVDTGDVSQVLVAYINK